jgi:hypothetical protein
VFGQPLKGKIPEIILNCFEILKEKAIQVEGIFRVPGSHAKIQEIKRLIDKGYLQVCILGNRKRKKSVR